MACNETRSGSSSIALLWPTHHPDGDKTFAPGRFYILIQIPLVLFLLEALAVEGLKVLLDITGCCLFLVVRSLQYVTVLEFLPVFAENLLDIA